MLGVSGTTSRRRATSLTQVWCTKRSSMTQQFCRCGRARSLARSTGSNEGIGISSARSNDTETESRSSVKPRPDSTTDSLAACRSCGDGATVRVSPTPPYCVTVI